MQGGMERERASPFGEGLTHRRLACHGAGILGPVMTTAVRGVTPLLRRQYPIFVSRMSKGSPMAEPLPVVRLKNAWNSTHPWIFQRLVEKPAQRPKPGSIVDVVGVDGVWIGRGFYNGQPRSALRKRENDPDVEVDAG